MNTAMDHLLDEFQQLCLEDKEYLTEIMQKRLRDSKRDYLASRINEARANYSSGETKSGDISTLLQDLEND
jgi:hypothetical protein